jgi:hypothetical protein
MMKVSATFTLVVFVSVSLLYNGNGQDKPITSCPLILENVEALASSEGSGIYMCFGSGSIQTNR